MAALDTAWVLVIEDLRDQAELCADVCADAGLNAMTAEDWPTGLSACPPQQPVGLLKRLIREHEAV